MVVIKYLKCYKLIMQQKLQPAKATLINYTENFVVKNYSMNVSNIFQNVMYWINLNRQNMQRERKKMLNKKFKLKAKKLNTFIFLPLIFV